MNEYPETLISAGNNCRLLKALQKTRNGEKIKIVFLGASVTAKTFDPTMFTKSYAEFFSERFGEEFGPAEIINSGDIGSGSIIGVYRIEHDVLRYEPDIVFVEFAISDYPTKETLECYEGILRKALLYKSKPAVIPVYVTTKNYDNTQSIKVPYGKHYDLMMISIHNYVKQKIDNGEMTWEDYSGDLTHPNNNGHSMICDIIFWCLKQAEQKSPDTEYNVPAPYFNGFYENAVSEYNIKKELKNKDIFSKTVVCRRFVIIYTLRPDPDYGSVEVYTDGKLFSTVEGYNITAWGNPSHEVISFSDEPAEHTVTIKLASYDQNKIFEINGICYC